LATADAAGFIVLHISEPMVMLTSKGREAAQPGRPAGRRIATHKPKS
jgi:hypothetical protein